MTLNKFIWFIFLCLFIILSTLAICENKCFGAETVDSKYIELGKHNNDYDIGILEFEGRKYLIFSSAKDMGMSPIIDENKFLILLNISLT